MVVHLLGDPLVFLLFDSVKNGVCRIQEPFWVGLIIDKPAGGDSVKERTVGQGLGGDRAEPLIAHTKAHFHESGPLLLDFFKTFF